MSCPLPQWFIEHPRSPQHYAGFYSLSGVTELVKRDLWEIHEKHNEKTTDSDDPDMFMMRRRPWT